MDFQVQPGSPVEMEGSHAGLQFTSRWLLASLGAESLCMHKGLDQWVFQCVPGQIFQVPERNPRLEFMLISST